MPGSTHAGVTTHAGVRSFLLPLLPVFDMIPPWLAPSASNSRTAFITSLRRSTGSGIAFCLYKKSPPTPAIAGVVIFTVDRYLLKRVRLGLLCYCYLKNKNRLPQRPLTRALLLYACYFFSCGVTNPIGRFLVSGGRINSRIALRTPAIA